MAGNAITGKDGDAKISSTQICEVTKWGFNPKVNIVAYASNKTMGYKQKIVGIREGQGTLEGVWDPANPAYAVLAEGTDNVALKLYLNATQFWAITAAIEDFKNDVNIDAGEVITWTATFHAKGVWTAPVSALMLADTLGPTDLGDMGIKDPSQPVFTPNAPLQKPGETMEQAAARLQAFYATLKLPDTMEEIVRRVSENVTRLQTPEGFEDAITQAAERAVGKVSDAWASVIADRVLYQLKDRLPEYQKANA